MQVGELGGGEEGVRGGVGGGHWVGGCGGFGGGWWELRLRGGGFLEVGGGGMGGGGWAIGGVGVEDFFAEGEAWRIGCRQGVSTLMVKVVYRLN